MISYKNISSYTKTFYGVKFNPGETHQVPGYINSSGMIPVVHDCLATSDSMTLSSKESSESSELDTAEDKKALSSEDKSVKKSTTRTTKSTTKKEKEKEK